MLTVNLLPALSLVRTRSCVYFVGFADLLDGPVKIGWAEQPTLRLSSLQTGNPRKLVLYATARGGEREERELHAHFAASHRRGEWFGLTAELCWLMELLGAQLGCRVEDPLGPARRDAIRERFKTLVSDAVPVLGGVKAARRLSRLL